MRDSIYTESDKSGKLNQQSNKKIMEFNIKRKSVMLNDDTQVINLKKFN